MASRKLEVTIVGDSSSLGRALREATGHADSFGRSLARVGKIATLALGAGVATGLTMAVKSAVDFEREMRNVNSIARLGETDFKNLGKSVTGMAAEVGQKPKVLAAGLYDIVSSGFKAQGALKVLRVSAKAATAGMTDTATASKAVTAALNAYHLGADKARKVSDILFQTVNKGVLTFEELSQNMGDLVPAAAPLGVSLEEVGAAMATLTLQGVPAAEAATRVKNTMLQLAKPSATLSKLFKDQGFASGEAAVKSLGFAGVLQMISDKTKGNVTATSKLTPEIRSLLGVVGLTGKNLKVYLANLAAMTEAQKGAGITAQVFAEQSKSVGVQWQKVSAAIDVFKIQIGTALLPALKTALQGVNKFFAQLNAAEGFKAKVKVVFTDVGNALKALKEGLFGGTTSPIANMPEVKIPFDGIVQKGIAAVNWAAVGTTIMDGIVRGLSAAGEIAGKLSAVFNETLDKIDWEAAGTKIGPALAAGVLAGVATLLDPAFWARHWEEMLAIALTVLPVGKLAGLGGKLVAGLVKPVSETLGPLLRAAMTRAGDIVITVAARLPARLGSVFLNAVLLAARTMARLPGAIGSALGNLGSYVAGKLGSFKTFVIKALAFDAIIHAVVNSVGKLINAIQNAFQRLWAWLRGVAPGIARSAGFAIGNALTGGVLAGLGDLAGRIRGVVQGALSHLPHISIPGFSPIQHVGVVIGKDLGGGIILGFLNGTANLPDKVKGKLKAALEAGKKVVEGYRSAFEAVFGRMLDLALRAFDAKTQKKLDQFAAQAAALTPAEQQLAGIDSRRAAEDRARAIQDAQQRLTEAQASGDPAAIIDAQRTLDRALEDEQIASLQRQAETERAAQEAQIAEEQKNYEFRREQQRLHLEAQVTALEKGLESGHLTQKQFHDRLIKLLKANGVDMKEAGDLLGTAFAAGLERAINKVIAAANRLAAAIRKILKLRSPAEEGPLSDLDTWWTSLGDTLAAQLDTSKVSAAAEAMAAALRSPITGALDDLDAAFARVAGGALRVGGPSLVAGSAGGGVIELHSHTYLDSKEIWTSVQRHQIGYSQRNAASGLA